MDSKTINLNGCVRLPVRFFQDHYERALDTPQVVFRTAKAVWVRLDDPALPELLDDAEFYCDPFGPDGEGLTGLKSSARATVKAIRAALGGRA